MSRQFDEVMIVNPAPLGADPTTGERIMMNQFGYLGGYAAAPEQVAGYQYADPYGLAYGGFAYPYGYAGYGFAGPWGFAQPYAYGDPYQYADPNDYGQSYEADDGVSEYADYGDYGDYGEATDYAEYADDEFGADEDGVGWYGADDLDNYNVAGYVAEGPSPYNYTVPGSSALSGYGAEGDLDGYTPPRDVSPTVRSFNPLPSPAIDLPDTLKPLW